MLGQFIREFPRNLLKVKILLVQLRPTLFNPMDCSRPGFSVQRIIQARKLQWVVISLSREFF